MANAWISGAEILAHVRISAPTADEAAWAASCADAVNGGLDRMLQWEATDPPYDPPQAAMDEIKANALTAGAEAYARRSAPFGVTGYADLQGIAIRVARDYLEGIRPQIERWRYVAGTFS